MKKYHVDYSKDAQRDLKNLDNSIRARIIKYIETNLEVCENPRLRGKPLHGPLRGNWSYRVGNYRIIAEIEDDKILITVVKIDHRRQSYRR